MQKKRIVSTIAALTLATAGALTMAPADAGPADKAARKKATNFAFVASGFGTKVTGGQVPAGSGTSAYEAFGCRTRQASYAETSSPRSSCPAPPGPRTSPRGSRPARRAA